MFDNVAQFRNTTSTAKARADAHFAMRMPSATLAMLNRAATTDGRSASAMAVRLIQIGLAAMVTDGRLAT